MSAHEQIQRGMTVYGADGQILGEVKDVWGETLYAGDETIPTDAVDRVVDGGVYLKANPSLLPMDPPPDRHVTASQGTASASNDDRHVDDRQVDAASIMGAATIPGVGSAADVEPRGESDLR